MIPISDVDEAVELANDTAFGLLGSVHADNVVVGKRIAERMGAKILHVKDQPITDEAHVPFSDTRTSGGDGFDIEKFLTEVIETAWILLQYDF
ncbi:aldehyde dehydrogenase family protein [Natronorubrum sp. DTA7]|uniref:aldehyde dehydrogenase family protein n=1 Tax=Natronorubrum sp. DTA7 TaxID=3447016 RepID=UPI003F858B68